MVDSHTNSKLWGNGFSSTISREYRTSEFLQLKKCYLRNEPGIVHSCSKKLMKKEDDDDWLVFLLSFGLQQTITDLNQMTDLRNGNSLLHQAKLDNVNDSFLYPKSICSTKDDTIIIADTGNNRVIAFNGGGVQVFLFDKFEFKNETQALSMPLSVCVLSSGYIAVCNYGNSTINIITKRGTSRLMFPCSLRPIVIDSDHSGTIFVLTESGEIEQYSKSGKIIRADKMVNKRGGIYTIMAVAPLQNEIYLGQCNAAEILVTTKRGERLRCMTLYIPGSGLNVFLSGFCQGLNDQILVADSVNRSIHAFCSRTGKYGTTVINGKSGLGCVQAVCLTESKCLVTAEYSLNHDHCVKIFSLTNNFDEKKD